MPIGSAVATTATTTVTTDGLAAHALADGQHTITARQTEPGKPQSADSEALMIIVDTQPPTLDAWYSAAQHSALGEGLLGILADDTFCEPRLGGISRLLVAFSVGVATVASDSCASVTCWLSKPAWSNFDYADALNEFLMLGNVATQFEGKLDFDPQACKIIGNPAADKALRSEYRKGWTL